MSILEEAPRSATIIAMDDVKVLEFNKANFESLMTAKPELAIKLLKIFAKRIYDQKRRLMILVLNEPEARVADVFLMLAENKNINITDTKEVSFNINSEQVANWCGLDKVKCSEILNHLSRQNRVTIKPNEITIHNMNEFYRLVTSKRKSVFADK